MSNMTQHEFDTQHKRMLAYFWMEKGDPTRYVGWNVDEVRQFWPEFFLVWMQYRNLRLTLTALASEAINEHE